MYLKTKMDKHGNPVLKGMKVSLMQHQLIGVKWMAEKELNPTLGPRVKIEETGRRYGKALTKYTVGGGILADEMGLGKTIQSIALMLKNQPEPDEPVKVIAIRLKYLTQDYFDYSTIGLDPSVEKRDRETHQERNI
jgi:SNF2 family DNA or RNA helicase